MKTIAIALYLVLILLGATFAFGQTPSTAPKARGQQATEVLTPNPPSTAAPTVDSASTAALAPLAAKIAEVQKQMVALRDQFNALNVQLQALNSQWRITEGKALANANLDPAQYSVDPVDIKFIEKQNPAQGPRQPNRPTPSPTPPAK